MKRVGGFRRKSRNKLRKNVNDKGKVSIKNFIQSFNIKDKVSLVAEPAYQKAMYHPRFHSKTGVITGKQGKCYYVTINDGNKPKKLIVHPIHLKRV